MSFLEADFPTNLSYGTSGGPGFRTHIIEVDSGAEERVARWSGAGRRRYNAAYSIKSYDDLLAVQKFFILTQGSAKGFRFKDFGDFNSSSNGISSTSNVDQLIGVGNGTTTQFQLVKRYTNGLTTQVRNITKPVAGSVSIAVAGVNQASGWTVDTTTGIVTFSSAPASGNITAGFEFRVPVRFGQEVDDLLAFRWDDFGSGSFPSIPLVELVDEGVINDEFFYGGAASFSSADSISISPQSGRVVSVNMTTTGKAVTLPNFTSLPLGGPYFYLANTGSNSWDLKSHTGSTIRSVASGVRVMIVLGVDGSNNKAWYVI